MKHSIKFIILFNLLLLVNNSVKAQEDIIKVEIIDSSDTDSVKITVVELEWPYKGLPPVGSSNPVIDSLNSKLNKAGVECPPERVKLSSFIWKCGNGKKIRTNDRRLAIVLSSIWDD